MCWLTAGDFASDVVYVAASAYYSLTAWAFALFFTVAPTFFFYMSSGALRAPWLTYAYRACKIIRGRKLWRDGKLQLGLAVEFKSWDDALAVLAFGIYLLILRPVITVLLYPRSAKISTAWVLVFTLLYTFSMRPDSSMT